MTPMPRRPSFVAPTSDASSGSTGSPGSPNGGYDVVLIDPPWSYTGSQTKWGAAAKFYPMMSDTELEQFTLPVDVLAPRGVLFMWATSPRLDFAIDLIRTWGLTYRGVSFVWVKTKNDHVTPIGAQGVRPSTVKPTTEFVIAASRVTQGRPLKLSDESIRQVVLAPKTQHSAKPVMVHERIEAMYPNARRLEVFARAARPGWDAWGNEIDATHQAVPAVQAGGAGVVPLPGVRPRLVRTDTDTDLVGDTPDESA